MGLMIFQSIKAWQNEAKFLTICFQLVFVMREQGGGGDDINIAVQQCICRNLHAS